MTATLIGIAATAAGAGVGIRYLQKTGLTAGTVVGLALLAIGLVLLGFATSVFWKDLHRWSRLWLAPAAIIVLLVILSDAQAAALAIVPPTALGPGTPQSVGLSYRNVTFTTADGVRLSAWYVPSRDHAALVLLHGSGSTRTATLPQAGVLGRRGYGLLLVDARGHGRSGGRGMDLGWYGDQDIAAAVTFLSDQPGVDASRIGVLGLSMGGEEAIGAAATDHRVRAVVAEGATARTAADKDNWLPGGVAGAMQRGLDRFTYASTDLLTPASPPIPLHSAVQAAAHTKFLLITAGTVPDESLAADDLREAAPGRVSVWNVPGAAHTQGLATAPRAWDRHVTSFLDAQLKPAGRAP